MTTKNKEKEGGETKPPLFPNTKFKNKETEIEITRIISNYEGVPIENVRNYVNQLHLNTKTELFLKTKNNLINFWKETCPDLNHSDFKGLIDLSMMDISLSIIKKGDETSKRVMEIQDNLNELAKIMKKK